MSDPRLPIPRPAWCPECGSEYAGPADVCGTCGYDAGGELVLHVALGDPRKFNWQRRLCPLLAVAFAGAAVATLWLSAQSSSLKIAAFLMALIAIGLFAQKAEVFASPLTRHWAGQIRFGRAALAFGPDCVLAPAP